MQKKFFSLQYKFLIYFLLLSIFSSVVTGWFSFTQTSRVIVRKANELYQQKVDVIGSNIEAILSQVNQVSHLMLQDGDVRSYLYGSHSKDENEMMRFLLPFTDYNSSIRSVCIQSNGDRRLSINWASELPIGDKKLLDHADELRGGYFWERQTVPVSSLNRNPYTVFSFVRQYRDMYNLSNHIGYIRIDVQEDTISKLCADPAAEGIFLLSDFDGSLLFSTNPDWLGLRLDGPLPPQSSPHDKPITRTQLCGLPLDREYLMVYSTIKSSRGAVINLVPLETVVRDNAVIASVIASVIAVNIVLCVLLASVISRRQLAPLRALTQLIADAKHQNFKEYIGETNNDEIGILANEFNNMSQHLELMVNKVYAAQLKQDEAEFCALQAQINPHFLYNTLDTIYWVAKLENAPESAELVRILGDLFRLSLNKGNGITTVENEVNHLSGYLLIQRKRHHESVAVSLQVDPDTMAAQTIKLVLQPLVENAFLHGLEKKSSKGSVHVEVSRVGDDLVYTIQDDGVGMSLAEVERLTQGTGGSGLGIKNVNERIRLLFGKQYGVTIESTPGAGTKITVVQPFVLFSS